VFVKNLDELCETLNEFNLILAGPQMYAAHRQVCLFCFLITSEPSGRKIFAYWITISLPGGLSSHSLSGCIYDSPFCGCTWLANSMCMYVTG